MTSVVGGHLVSRSLKSEGVRCIFTLCGGHVAPIYDGCVRDGIDILDTRHEQAAAHAADGWARLTRAPGVAVVTAGPGVTDARRIPEMIQAAFRHAMTGVPGPVFLELPFDVLTAQVDDPPLRPPLPAWPRLAGDPDAIDAAARLLAAAERPVAFVGSQVWWDDAAKELRAFVEALGIPTVMNAMGRGALPASHPFALQQARKNAFRKTDCILVVGTPLDFRVGYGAGIAAEAKVIQIERDATRVAQNRAAHAAILGDTRLVLPALADAAAAAGARPARFRPWVEDLRAAEAKAEKELALHALSDAKPINHYRLGRAIADAVAPYGDDVILIGDGGDCVALASKVIPLSSPGRWLDPGPLGCLGVGAPFAMAAKKLYPKKRVLVISGDGSFGLNGFDYESCIRFGLPVTVVVANDAAWGQIRGPQIMIFGGERAPATKLAPTRYDRVVEAFGGVGMQIDDPAALVPAIRAALDSDRVSCINVPIDPEFVLRIGAAKLSV